MFHFSASPAFLAKLVDGGSERSRVLHPESGIKENAPTRFRLISRTSTSAAFTLTSTKGFSWMRKPGGEPGVAITASVRATRIAVYGPAGDARFIEYRLTVDFFYPSSYLSRYDHSYDKQLYSRTIMPAEN